VSSRLLALGLAFLIGALPSLARADDAADARAEYAAGLASLSKNAYREAAEHFEIAARLRPHAVAFFAAGKAWQLAGEPVKSADRLSAALERNELSPADKGDAIHRLAAIEEKVGTVNVTGDASMELQIDDGPSVKPPGARHATPGKHTLFIRGARGSATRDVSLNAGGSMSIELKLEMLVDKPNGAAPPEPRPAPSPPALPEEPQPAGGGSGFRTAGIVALVGCGVGAGTSIGLGVAALSAKSRFLNSRTQSDFDSAIHLQTATNVGWVATAALGAVGATLVVIAIVKKPSSSSSAALELHPYGASLSGRF
jgi:hypothetical protein